MMTLFRLPRMPPVVFFPAHLPAQQARLNRFRRGYTMPEYLRVMIWCSRGRLLPFWSGQD
uniref:Uncharacterized protein n=1 Tax=Yersinia enterocolitica TaxID=630 RepID=B0RL65_YEREN|nr:hypothetical protein [Yersinia enterocolitica]